MTPRLSSLCNAFAARRWRTAATATTLACATALSACASGVTYIEGGQTFLLGGNQALPLAVQGRNLGDVQVEILGRKEGVVSEAKKVDPGQLFSQRFAAGETVLIRNTSTTRQARVGVEFTDLIQQMSMRYEANAAGTAAGSAAGNAASAPGAK
jgi:hypothetical protein